MRFLFKLPFLYHYQLSSIVRLNVLNDFIHGIYFIIIYSLINRSTFFQIIPPEIVELEAADL